MKRKISSMLCVCLVATMLVGCGNGEGNKDTSSESGLSEGTQSEQMSETQGLEDSQTLDTKVVTSLKYITKYDINNTVLQQTKYEYGDNGNIHTITVFDQDRNVYGKTEYIYGEDGVEWIVYGADGEIDSVTEIKKGRFEKDSFRVFIDKGELFAPHGVIRYDRENEQFIMGAFNKDGMLCEVYQIYDKAGNLIKNMKYTVSNGNVDYSAGSGKIYTYGPNNTMILGGTIVNNRETYFNYQYECDCNDNVSKITLLNGNKKVGWYECTYDSNKILTERTLYGEDGSFQYIEEYDSSGNIISKRYDSTYTWYRDEYDSNNNLIKRVWYNNEGRYI